MALAPGTAYHTAFITRQKRQGYSVRSRDMGDITGLRPDREVVRIRNLKVLDADGARRVAIPVFAEDEVLTGIVLLQSISGKRTGRWVSLRSRGGGCGRQQDAETCLGARGFWITAVYMTLLHF